MSFPLLTHANKSRIEIAKKNFLEIIQTALKLQEGFSLIFPILPCQRHRIKMTFYIFMNIITIDLLFIDMVNNIEADNDTTSEKLCFI